MARRLANITLDNLDDLPRRCRKCVFWELDPVAGARAAETGDTELEKEAWTSGVLLEWGSCGKIAYVDGVPAGYVLFAPPAYVPRRRFAAGLSEFVLHARYGSPLRGSPHARFRRPYSPAGR